MYVLQTCDAVVIDTNFPLIEIFAKIASWGRRYMVTNRCFQDPEKYAFTTWNIVDMQATSCITWMLISLWMMKKWRSDERYEIRFQRAYLTAVLPRGFLCRPLHAETSMGDQDWRWRRAKRSGLWGRWVGEAGVVISKVCGVGGGERDGFTAVQWRLNPCFFTILSSWYSERVICAHKLYSRS